MAAERSLIAQGLESFRQPDAIARLREARDLLDAALALYREGRHPEACHPLVRASALWTHATWEEFLQDDVIGADVPGAYRPIED
jgi:hypothetical protein